MVVCGKEETHRNVLVGTTQERSGGDDSRYVQFAPQERSGGDDKFLSKNKGRRLKPL